MLWLRNTLDTEHLEEEGEEEEVKDSKEWLNEVLRYCSRVVQGWWQSPDPL